MSHLFIMLISLLVPVYAAVHPVTVTWEGRTATLEWTETLADTAAAPGEVPWSLSAGPYLVRLADTFVIAGWQTAALKYKNIYTILLDDLEPTSAYAYKLLCRGADYTFESGPHPFRTNPRPDVRVAWQGNLAVISWDECLADPNTPPGEPPFCVITGPFLGSLTDTAVTVGWEVFAGNSPERTEIQTGDIPWYSESFGRNMTHDSLKYFDFRKARLAGLTPDTEYRYVLVSTGSGFLYVSDTFTVRTYPSAVSNDRPFRFAVLGDTRSYSLLTELNLNRLMAWRPQMWMNNGDIISSAGGTGGYTVGAKTAYMKILQITRAINPGTFHAPTMGNWDIDPKEGKARIHQSIHDYFYPWPVPVNGAGPARPPYYYSYDAAGIHFVALCTEFTGDKTALHYEGFSMNEMYTWLEADLQNSTAEWKIVQFHTPDMISMQAGPNNEALGSILTRYGVQLVFKASAHLYRRTYRKGYTSGGTKYKSDSGFVEIISGGGGHRALTPADYYGILYNEPGCPVCTDDTELACKIIHHVRLSVYPDAIHVSTVDSGGTVFDTWQLPKIGQPAVLVTNGVALQAPVSPGGPDDLVIKPNPFNPVARLAYPVPYTQTVRLTVLDVSGQRVFTRTGIRQKGLQVEMVDFSKKRGGVYIVKVELGSRTFTKAMLCVK